MFESPSTLAPISKAWLNGGDLPLWEPGTVTWVFAVFRSALSTFASTQNAAAELRRRYQMKFSRENKP